MCSHVPIYRVNPPLFALTLNLCARLGLLGPDVGSIETSGTGVVRGIRRGRCCHCLRRPLLWLSCVHSQLAEEMGWRTNHAASCPSPSSFLYSPLLSCPLLLPLSSLNFLPLFLYSCVCCKLIIISVQLHEAISEMVAVVGDTVVAVT